MLYGYLTYRIIKYINNFISLNNYLMRRNILLHLHILLVKAKQESNTWVASRKALYYGQKLDLASFNLL
jgi:hypothetical protein